MRLYRWFFSRVVPFVAELDASIAAIALILGVILNVANVIGRYCFHAPISWAEEMLLDLMTVTVFIGASAIAYKSSHIHMGLVLQFFPSWFRTVAVLASNLAFAFVAALMVYLAVPVIRQTIEFHQVTEATGMSAAIPLSILPLGFFLMIIALVGRSSKRSS